jgi:hypothetical protein
MTNAETSGVMEVMDAAYASCPSIRRSASREVADASDALKTLALSFAHASTVPIDDTQSFYLNKPPSQPTASHEFNHAYFIPRSETFSYQFVGNPEI